MIAVASVTRYALRGGVETMLAMHQKYLNASVFVAGGTNRPDICPFTYTYIDESNPSVAQQRLTRCLRGFDVVIYHWVPYWAQVAIRDADRPCIEVVHREDTADNDKTIPTLLVTPSQFLADFLQRTCGRDAVVIPHGIDVGRFRASGTGRYVGAISSYYWYKGIDLLLEAWSLLQARYPQLGLRVYGGGPDRGEFERRARELQLERAELLGPVVKPERHLGEFRLFVQPLCAEGVVPFAVMEALASNVPVVTSDLSGMREFNAMAVSRGFPEPLVLHRSEDVDDLIDKVIACLDGDVAPLDTRAYIERYFSPYEHCRLYWLAIGKAMRLHERTATTWSVPAL